MSFASLDGPAHDHTGNDNVANRQVQFRVVAASRAAQR
jgi:hypothetical protein